MKHTAIRKNCIFNLIRNIALVSFFFSVCVSASAFVVVNPIHGNWANKQPLVIDLMPGEEAYYSVNGADPYTSGFAYDSPILLDVTGNVHLRVTMVDCDGLRKDSEINYHVTENTGAGDINTFISSVSTRPVTKYVAGTEFSIPESMEYCFAYESEQWFPGKTLSLDSSVVLSRFVPCMVTDGNSIWRFVIAVTPYVTGTFTKRDMPFEVTDWSIVSEFDKKYIYKFDDSMWVQPTEDIVLDKNKPHTVSWQHIAYVRGNPVQTFSLPAKVPLQISRNKYGAVTVTSSVKGIRLAAIYPDGGPTELFDKISIDAFEGERIAGVVTVGIYSDTVYMGQEDVSFIIDRTPPLPPVITADVAGDFVRRTVNAHVKAEKGTSIYVAATSRAVPSGSHIANDVNFLEAVPSENFVQVAQSSAKVELSQRDGAVLYTLWAYAVDAAGNKSKISSYSVVIDTSNFFVAEGADPTIADGSKSRPFADLISCFAAAHEPSLMHVYIDGEIKVKETDSVVIFSDCIIEGVNDRSKITFDGGNLIVYAGKMAVNNCILNFNSASRQPSIKLVNSSMSVAKSEIYASSENNAVLVDADNSFISVADSGLTVSAKNYASCIAAVATNISVVRSRLASSASTAVAVSAQKGQVAMSDSSFYVSGSVGRVAEFFGMNVNINGNTYEPTLSRASEHTELIYADSDSVVAGADSTAIN